MPGIDELLRTEGERWRAEVDAPRPPAAAPAPSSRRRPWTTTRSRVWTVSVAGVAAAAVVVLAVGLGSDSSNSNNTGSSVASPAAGGAAASSVPGAALQPGKLAPSIASNAAPSAPASMALVLTGSVSLTVNRNADVARAATSATGIADAAGGRVDDDTRSTGTRPSATLVLRVPNASLPNVRTQLARLGTVRSQDLRTKDVTSQVADVNSRVTSARAAIAALDRLYAKARTVRDLITVETALASRQSDLEALETQQRTLTAQTSLATVTLSIDVRAPAAAKHHHRSGFLGGLNRGWHAFTSTARALATAAGAVLPFAVLALVLGAAGWLAVRRRRA